MPDGLNDLMSYVARAIARLVTSDVASVVLVPHDRRGTLSDEALSADLLGRLPEEVAEHVIDAGRLSVGESRWLAGQVDVAVSGRMHLAISCLVAGTPVVCVSYQEKFSGVLREVGLEHLMLKPADLRAPAELRRRLIGALALRGQLASHAAERRRLATENLAFLRGDDTSEE
jgi:polysaccharide pyruvyl transferase WcaK-like protein